MVDHQMGLRATAVNAVCLPKLVKLGNQVIHGCALRAISGLPLYVAEGIFGTHIPKQGICAASQVYRIRRGRWDCFFFINIVCRQLWLTTA